MGSEKQPQQWRHSRKGIITGIDRTRVGDEEWAVIELTEDQWLRRVKPGTPPTAHKAGETITVRRSFLTEITPEVKL